MDINVEAFYDVPKLQKLVFTKNNVTTIRNGTFQYTFNLLELDLNKNNIHYLNRWTLDGLANLRKLDLRENRIQNLTEFTFSELWNLQELLLGKNDLSYISERAFDGLSQLRKLSLHDNKLASLPSGLFEGVRGLSSVDLRCNGLHALTYEDIEPILDNLKSQNSDLLLEENNFVCDCRLKWMFTLHNDTKSENTKKSLNDVTCKIDPPVVSSAYNKMPDAMDNKLDYNQDIIRADLTIETVNDKMNVTAKNTLPGNLLIDDANEISKKSVKRTILHIPPETLPCPRESIKITEIPPYIVDSVKPMQNEMKIYKFHESNSGYMRSSCEVLVLSSVCFRFFFTKVSEVST